MFTKASILDVLSVSWLPLCLLQAEYMPQQALM